ncbi:MAG: 50S ribosomal protein L33 [Bdellovibrionales bacterium]
MAKKSNKDNLVRLVSAAGTGYSIVRKKNPRKTEKLKLRKYDPFTRKHEDFEEKKLPSPKKN